MSLPPPPIKSPIYSPGGAMAPVWVQWLQRLYTNLGGADSIIPVARGGTGIATGISGAVLGFTAAGVIASSAQLGANQIVVGGGAGVLPTTPLGLGTATTLLHGNAAGAPSWGQVSLTADVAGILPVANGGTGLASGTSGGVLGFTGVGTIASSTALTANALVLGGGAGATPSTPVGLGTSTTLLHGNAIGAPTWSAVSLTADVSGQLPLANGGTNANLTAANGGVVYSTAAALAINTPGSSGNWLKSIGAGAPAWTAPAALTKTDDTNVTATLGGSAATALLNAASITLGWTGQLGLTRGGTAASLVASNGGIVYSDASAMAVLSGTATAGQILRSGASAAPSWSTATYPTTAGTAANVLRSNGTNFLSAALAAADLSNGVTGSGAVMLAASPTTTGTLGAAAATFSGKISLTGGASYAGYVMMDWSGATTGGYVAQGSNTSGQIKWGLEGSAGGELFGSTTAYATVFGTTVNKPVEFAVNNGMKVSLQNSAMYFPVVGTTASAANAFLDNATTPANSLLRSTSSLRYKPFVRPLELAEAQKIVLDGVPIAYMHESGQQGVGLAAEWEARDARMVTFDKWGRPDWVQYPHYVAPLMLVAQDHERRLRAAGF